MIDDELWQRTLRLHELQPELVLYRAEKLRASEELGGGTVRAASPMKTAAITAAAAGIMAIRPQRLGRFSSCADSKRSTLPSDCT